MKRLRTLWLAVVAAAVSTPLRAAPAATDPVPIAAAAGTPQGLAVCVGPSDGRLEAALADAGLLVHAVSTDWAMVAAARAKLIEGGKAGVATADRIPTVAALPYNDNLANLLVADLDAAPGLTREEALRVVRPLGTAYLRIGGAWRAIRKPMPAEMDDWSHFDHGPDGNPQSTDKLVGVPKGLQWLASGAGSPTSNTRLAGGRWFCGHLLSNGEKKSAAYFSARDAFNGMLLWRREEDRAMGDLRGVQERSLVASDGVVVGLIGEPGPARVLDAATGRERAVLADGLARPAVKRTFGKQVQTLQHVLVDGLLVQGYGADVVGLDAAAGKARWRWAAPQGHSVAFLVAGGGRAFVGLCRETEFEQFHYQNWFAELARLAAIDLRTGREIWSSDAVAGFKSFNIVYHDGAVYTIDSAFKPSAKKPDRLDVAVPYGALVRINAADGKVAFRRDLSGSGPKDLAWHNKLRVQDDALVPTFAYAVRTFSLADGSEGKTLFEMAKGFQDPLPFCSTARGTANGQLSGKFARFADFSTQTYTALTVGRTRCDEGSYPGYGMIYTGDDGCGCTSWLRGHLAMQCRQDTAALARVADDRRLERGPAYGAGADAAAASKQDEWPALLGGTRRFAATPAAAPADLAAAFVANVPVAKAGGSLGVEWAEHNQRCGTITPPVVAGGRVLVASTDAHTVHAFDAASGRPAWTYETGGRIDSPPTVYRDLALVGSNDGYLYALRLSDGQLAWRFLAAPGRRNVVISGQVESLWPVHGAVAVLDDKVYVTAGRHNQTDGGVFLWRLDPVTGAIEASTVVTDRDSSSSPPGPATRDYHGRIADVLCVNDAGTWLYMGPIAIDPKTLAWCNLSVIPQIPLRNAPVPQQFIPGGPELNWETPSLTNFVFAPSTGTVDRRVSSAGSKGQFGFRWNAVDGYRGGLSAERMAKVDNAIYGARGATLVAWDLDEKGKPVGGPRVAPREVAKLPGSRCAALVAAGDRLVVATPAAGGKAALSVIGRDGATVASATLPAPVVTYGLAVAGGGRVYASLEDGSVVCLGR